MECYNCGEKITKKRKIGRTDIGFNSTYITCEECCATALPDAVLPKGTYDLRTRPITKITD